MVFLMSLFTVFFATAAPLESITCYQEVSDLSIKLAIQIPWRRAHETKNYTVLESEARDNQKFSAWLINRKDEVQLLVRKGEDLLQHSLRADSKCSIDFSLSKISSSFTALDFLKTSLTTPRFVIIVWSPNMAISLKELTVLHGEKFEVPVYFVLEKDGDERLGLDFLKKNSLPPYYIKRWSYPGRLPASIEHFPSTLFVKDGEVVKYVPGFNGPEGLRRLIKEQL